MKRVFVILVLASSLAACNNSADTTGEKKDSIDSVASEKKDMVDSAASEKKDMIDSTAEKKKDALDKADSIKH
jgi:PBP1b-binding outer membrane lipoprotein LpoB